MTERKLNEIWDSLNTNSPTQGAAKIVDDEAENVLVIYTTRGLVAVRRRNNQEPWEDIRRMNADEVE